MRPKGRKSDFWNFEYPAYRIQHPDEAEFFGLDPPTGLSPNSIMDQQNVSSMMSPNASMIVPEFTPLITNPKSLKVKNKGGKVRNKNPGNPITGGHGPYAHQVGDGLMNSYNYNQMAQRQMINYRGGVQQFQQPTIEQQMKSYQQQMYRHYYNISPNPNEIYAPSPPAGVASSFGQQQRIDRNSGQMMYGEMTAQTSGDASKSMIYTRGVINDGGRTIDVPINSKVLNSSPQQGDSESTPRMAIKIEDMGIPNENVFVDGGDGHRNCGDGMVKIEDKEKSSVVVCGRDGCISRNNVGGDNYIFASRVRTGAGGRNHGGDGMLDALRNEKPVSSADKVLAWCPGGQSEVKNWSPYQGYMDTEISEREMGNYEIESGKSVNYSEKVMELNHVVTSGQMTRQPAQKFQQGFGSRNNNMNYGRNNLAFRPPWDNNIRDLNRHKLHPMQLVQRKFERISKNLPKAREELIKNGIRNDKFKEKISCLKKPKASPGTLMDSSKASPQGVNPSPFLLAYLEHHHLP